MMMLERETAIKPARKARPDGLRGLTTAARSNLGSPLFSPSGRMINCQTFATYKGQRIVSVLILQWGLTDTHELLRPDAGFRNAAAFLNVG